MGNHFTLAGGGQKPNVHYLFSLLVLKTRIQTLRKGLGEDSYNGITDCAR